MNDGEGILTLWERIAAYTRPISMRELLRRKLRMDDEIEVYSMRSDLIRYIYTRKRPPYERDGTWETEGL